MAVIDSVAADQGCPLRGVSLYIESSNGQELGLEMILI